MKTRMARGFTLIELLIVVAIIGIIAAIAVPGLLRARMAANEASAIGSLRAVNSGEAAFAATCGNNYYAYTLDALGAPPPSGGPGFISPDIGFYGYIKSGYIVRLIRDTNGVPPTDGTVACNGAALITAYFAYAHPATIGRTGNRSFATNTSATMYFSNTGAILTPGSNLSPLQ